MNAENLNNFSTGVQKQGEEEKALGWGEGKKSFKTKTAGAVAAASRSNRGKSSISDRRYF